MERIVLFILAFVVSITVNGEVFLNQTCKDRDGTPEVHRDIYTEISLCDELEYNGWEVYKNSSIHFRKVVTPNYPHLNKGRRIKVNEFGQKCVQMVVKSNGKAYFCEDLLYNGSIGCAKFLNAETKHLYSYSAEGFKVWSGNEFLFDINKIQNIWFSCVSSRGSYSGYNPNYLERDNLGRLKKVHFTGAQMRDDYKADGLTMTYQYYGDSRLIKRINIKGYGDYPRDKESQHKVFGRDFNERDNNIDYYYDPIKRSVRYVKTTRDKVIEETVILKEYTIYSNAINGMGVWEVEEYDCNGNPYIIRNTNVGMKLYIFYWYE